MKSAKALDSGSPNVVDLKRKRSAVPCETYNTDEVTKRIKLNGSSPSSKSMVKYYSDFKKSGLVHRLMNYHNGEWNDFPQEIVSSLKEELLAKKTAVEVESDGNKILLDFLHMVRVDLNSGLRRPIAWIDDSGKCFFPEIVGEEIEGADPVGSDDIKLHLDVEIKGLENMNVKEANGDANHENSAERDDDGEGADSCSHDSDVKSDDDTISAVAPVNGLLDLDFVNGLFIEGITSDEQVDVVEIQRCTSNALDARLELFHKQVEITEEYRGDANVVHAWLPCSGGMVSSIMKYGIGYPGPANMNAMRGIYLTPANGSEISTSDLGPDENGTRHVVYCRVVMGNMEVVPLGSNQFHPSSEEFDSGADDLENPKQYIVWNMNMNSHIYPECVITYKVPSDVEGPLPGNDSSGVSSSQEEPIVMNPNSEKTPNGPVMPFSVLFAAITDKVSSDSMGHVMANYELFSNKEINRDEFIKKLRLIVGEALLKSVIKGLRSKIPSKPN